MKSHKTVQLLVTVASGNCQ